MPTRGRTKIREVDVEIVSSADPQEPFASLRTENPSPGPEEPFASLRAENPGDDECEIAFWQGYVRAAFYARLLADEDPLAAIAQSPFFRHRGKTPPEPNDATLAAYDALKKQLEHEGWRRVGTGSAWFSDLFGR